MEIKMKRVFILKGLDCPNCSAKIEKEVGALPGVESSVVNLMQQTLTVQSEKSADATLAEQVETIVHSHEPDVEVSEKTEPAVTKVYLLKGLDCPNCSAKIEKEVGELGGVASSTVNLMNQTLTVQAGTSVAASLLDTVTTIVHSHEPDVEVSEKQLEATAPVKKDEKAAVYNDEDKKRTIRLAVGAAVYAIGMALTVYQKEQVLEYAAQAESYSNHPIAKSILATYGKPIDQKQFSGFGEMSVSWLHFMVQGKKVLAGNSKLMESEKIAYAACDAAGTKFYVAADGSYVGCILIADEVKPDSKCAIAELKKIGVEKTVMLTGDDERIGKSVADELGLDAYYAQLLPDQKVEKLEMLDKQKRQGSKLAFVGDGINDAPVLARADVGIAMGGLGSDAAIEAADVVLMTDEPSKLVEAIDVAKATKRIVMQNIVIALGIKSVFLVLGALGMAGMWEAVFGDVGVTIIAVLNAMRILKK